MKNPRPRIGYTMSRNVSPPGEYIPGRPEDHVAYTSAIEEAGGEPVPLDGSTYERETEVLRTLDGLLLPGGDDELQLRPGSRLASILPPEAPRATTSRHHQAVLTDESCPGIIVALSPADGIPEALEIPGRRWVLGVQWHPEHLTDPE